MTINTQIVERLIKKQQEIEELQDQLRAAHRTPHEHPEKIASALIAELIDLIVTNPGMCGSICDAVYWITATGRKHPKRMKIISILMLEFRGIVNTNAVKYCSQSLGISERQVRNYFTEIQSDIYFRDVFTWQTKTKKNPGQS